MEPCAMRLKRAMYCNEACALLVSCVLVRTKLLLGFGGTRPIGRPLPSCCRPAFFSGARVDIDGDVDVHVPAWLEQVYRRGNS